MTGHEDLETLAALAEGRLPPEATARARAHLAGCRRCTAAYVDAVRYRAAWVARPEMFDRRSIAAHDLDAAVQSALGMRPRPPAWLLAGAAALLAVAVVTGWALWRPGAPSVGLELPAAVRAVSEAASAHGLVVPGGERGAATTAPELRAGAAELPPDLAREVDALTAEYEREPGRALPGARLVAALLAAGDAEAARDFGREALRHHPRDARLLVLQAAVHDRAGDAGAAEAALREAMQIAPRDPLVMLDLALVLRERGEATESAALLARVARSRVRPLAERAGRELRASR